jgi:hypothetical protein
MQKTDTLLLLARNKCTSPAAMKQKTPPRHAHKLTESQQERLGRIMTTCVGIVKYQKNSKRTI